MSGSEANLRPLRRRRLPGTDLEVTPVCAGGAVLASLPRAFGYEVPEERALATIRAVLAGPLNFLDTSASYGLGESERRIGVVLRELGGLPAGFVLSTKVDPDPETKDFSGEQALRSVEQSLGRLGLDRLQLLHLHDPERIPFEVAMAPRGPVEAMLRLQREGVVRHLGVAGGPVDLLRRFVETGAFQVVLTHNRYTLVDRSAGPLIEEARRAGVGVLNAAPYGGGILAKGPATVRTYAYREVSEMLRERIERASRLCEVSGLPLRRVALRFSVRDARIGATVVGLSRPERVGELAAELGAPVPEPLWEALDRELQPAGGWPG
ncbi:MAG: aldo/keto reductase [Candidatus Dormibacteraceae bacterium]